MKEEEDEGILLYSGIGVVDLNIRKPLKDET